MQAHILICFLAYVIWKALGQMCQRAGLGSEPRKVFEEIAQIQMMEDPGNLLGYCIQF